jgi:tetratricopeptide (TPR) repeat protein
MFERLMLCHYAVADITGANPNVFYELGIRHAMRPRSTVIVLNEGTVLPFDIALVRGIAYKTDAGGEPVEVEATRAAIADQLKSARGLPHDDSPIFQLIEGLPRFEVDHAKTDIFRQAVDYSEKYKERLHAAVREGPEAVETIANEPALANLLEIEGGVVVDLFLSLRDVKAHAAMIDLYERMPRPLQRAKMMREQLAFALNREGRFEEAEKVLKEVIAEFGPSSETNGLLGRVYKDRWDRAKQEGLPEARALLKNAIDTYLAGFEADWRDAYPGVNAVTLMEMMPKPDPRQADILPVVRYASARKARANPDYWDYATLLELTMPRSSSAKRWPWRARLGSSRLRPGTWA